MRVLLFVLLFIAALFVQVACSIAQAAGKTDAVADEAGGASATASDGEESSEEASRYIRVKQSDEDQPVALQTAIVRYEGKPGSEFEGRFVDLVGVVHIGQREYYEALNERLAEYDRVLYELVAPDGTRIRPEDLENRRSILASMQSGMKDMLNLKYQLELVDYTSEHFRHADMSPQEFAKDFERRGDSVWKMMARMMGASLASQSQAGGDVGFLMALFSDDRAKRMKQTMARQLVDVEIVTAGLNDANGENTLIQGRNAKAFKILRQQLKAGHDELAVFYGAGHLPDMAQRLEEEFDMRAVETTWLDAWDLTRN